MMDLEALLRAARDEEPGAWPALFPHLFTALYRYFFACKFDRADAVELAQRTAAIVIQKLPGFKARGSSLTAWMYGVARKRALMELRTRRRQAALKDAFAQLLPRSTMSPSSRVEMQELLTIVLEELTKLPPHYQRAIENMLDDGDIKSFAARQGIPQETARTHLFRALQRLRRLLADRLASPPAPASGAPVSVEGSPPRTPGP